MENKLSKEVKAALDALKLNPTQEDPQLGICNTCNPSKKVFINELLDLENPNSCFMLAHDVEPLAGIPWQQTADYKKQYAQELIQEEGWLL